MLKTYVGKINKFVNLAQDKDMLGLEETIIKPIISEKRIIPHWYDI
jgi:hypothetical protein